MIKHFKTPESSLLRQTELLNLGKINIICGKNNSGKTTLLEVIDKNENTLIGKEITDDEISVFMSILEKSLAEVTLKTDEEFIEFPKLVSSIDTKKIFIELAQEKKIWFSSDVYTLFENFWVSFLGQVFAKPETENNFGFILNDYSRAELKGHLQDIKTKAEIKKVFERVFERIYSSGVFDLEKEDSILVSPKRLLSDKSIISKVDQVSANGRDIISKLFDLKNKNPGSESHKFYNKLYEAFIKVTGGYEFSIPNDEAGNDISLFFSLVGENKWIDAKYCGLGLQDLLVILYFALESETPLILLEEPENHLHPEMQRKLLRFLAEDTDKQFFITTHSNIFVNSTYVDRVFFTKFEGDTITVNDETKQAEILHDLGYSVTDNLVSDLIILVEGSTDTPIVEEYLSKLKVDEKYNIKTWALGGDLMDKHNLSVFAERYKVMALIDRDPKSQKIRKKFTDNCNNFNIPVTRLKRYSIENYFSVRALKVVFKGQISDGLTEIEPDKKLFDQIQIDVKNNNRKLAKEMTLEEIQGTDLRLFFDNVLINLQK